MSGRELLSLITQTTKTRFVSLAILLWFGAVFNIERFTLVGDINISNILYAIVALIGVAIIAFPNLRDIKLGYLLAGSIVVFAIATSLMKLWDHYADRPGLLVLEAGILVVSTVMLRLLGRLLLDLEMGLQIFYLQPQKSPIQTVTDARERLEQELARTSLFDGRMAVLYCGTYDDREPDPEPIHINESLNKHIEFNLKQHYQRMELGRYITALTYKSDITVFYREGFLIFLPTTGEDEVTKFLNDLSMLIRANTKLNLLAGVAHFPTDGATIDELINHARARVHVHFRNTDDHSKLRAGDVVVDSEQRVAVEKKTEWVNNLAYQSASARLIYRAVKRMIDFLSAAVVVPFALPVMGIIALLVYLDDGMPILYAQERTGYGGRRFKMYKFRTMKAGAKSVPPEKIVTPDGQVRYVWPEKNDSDPRITRVGRILRKTSLDEVPQLWNVLVGDMSLVGPRPTSWNVDMYTLLQTERLSVRPGITGLWQVSARETQNFDERLLWDVKYVEKMSLWLDIQILWRTVAQVVNRKGV